VLATVAFAGLGLLMAGTLPALTTLAAANGLYPPPAPARRHDHPPCQAPHGPAPRRGGAPGGALSDIFHKAFTGHPVPGRAWLVLLALAVVAPVAAAIWFRWE